jgi:hypothetical protein
MRNWIQRGMFVLLMFAMMSLHAADTLVWNKDKDRVDADVRGVGLLPLLERIAQESGWHIFVEPDATNHSASVKFKDLPSGEALHLLLGDLNFAFVPQTNAAPHLYVFRTAIQKATQVVNATAKPRSALPKKVPNELIVKLKPGANIDELARRLGAKVVGRIPELNAYRLQFDGAAATDAARGQLANDPDAVSVEDNYYVNIPTQPQPVTGVSASAVQLKLNPPPDSGKVVVGLVDTAVDPLSSDLEQFILKRLSVADGSQASDSTLTHGTAMLETILSNLQMVEKGSSSVQVVSVDVFGGSEQANTFNVAWGLITAGNTGATVINSSLGGYGDSSLLGDAVKQLSDHGITIFAAVGNDASSNPFYPAAYPQVVSVTALADPGKIASYANIGITPDAAAPGTVLVTYNGQTYVVQGTSSATAIATGVAAGIADMTHASWSQVVPTVEKNLPVPK